MAAEGEAGGRQLSVEFACAQSGTRPCIRWLLGLTQTSITHSLQAVDTVLAKLYAAHDKNSELHELLSQENYIVLTEIEPVLQQTRRYNALCNLYQQSGDDAKLLESWAK